MKIKQNISFILMILLIILSIVTTKKTAAEKAELKRQHKELVLEQELENILEELIQTSGVREFTQLEHLKDPDLPAIQPEIIEEVPIQKINKKNSFINSLKNLFGCLSKVEKPNKKQINLPSQPERKHEITESELKAEIIDNENFQIEFDRQVEINKVEIPFPIINSYKITLINTKQGKKEFYDQHHEKLKRPHPGIAITLDYFNLLKIKNYILPTIINLFNNIEFDIQYQTSVLLIDKLTTTIPLDKFPNPLSHINLEFNKEEQAVDLVLRKVPLVVKMKIEVKAGNTVIDKGVIAVVGVIDLLKAIFHFKESEEYLFKPRVVCQLSHWELDRSKFHFRTNMVKVNDYILSKIIGHFKNKILFILKDYIKYALPSQMSPMINDYIEENYQSFYFFGNEGNTGINLLWTHVPEVTDKTLTLYVSGDVFEKENYNDILIYSYDEKPIPGNMHTFNTEFSMRRQFINKLLFTFLKTRIEENFEVPALKVNWQVNLRYDEIFVEMLNNIIELNNISFKFYKKLGIEISCQGYINLKIHTRNINLKTGKIKLSIESINKVIKTNNLGVFYKFSDSIFSAIVQKFIPEEIEIPPFELPMGLTMGDITFSEADTNVHLGSVLDIQEMFREHLLENEESGESFELRISDEEDEDEGVRDSMFRDGRLGFGLPDMMIDSTDQRKVYVAPLIQKRFII